jgi:hypothetical protein
MVIHGTFFIFIHVPHNFFFEKLMYKHSMFRCTREILFQMFMSFFKKIYVLFFIIDSYAYAPEKCNTTLIEQQP